MENAEFLSILTQAVLKHGDKEQQAAWRKHLQAYAEVAQGLIEELDKGLLPS